MRPNSSIPLNLLGILQHLFPVKKGARQVPQLCSIMVSWTLRQNFFLLAFLGESICLLFLMLMTSWILAVGCSTLSRISKFSKMNRPNELKEALPSFNFKKTEIVLYNWRIPFTSVVYLDGSLIITADHITCLGLPIGSLIDYTCRILIYHAERKISIPYAGIVKIKKKSALHCPFLEIFTDKNHLRWIFFRFAKYLLQLPHWTRNRKIMNMYKLTDPNIHINKSLSRFQRNFHHSRLSICFQYFIHNNVMYIMKSFLSYI